MLIFNNIFNTIHKYLQKSGKNLKQNVKILKQIMIYYSFLVFLQYFVFH